LIDKLVKVYNTKRRDLVIGCRRLYRRRLFGLVGQCLHNSKLCNYFNQFSFYWSSLWESPQSMFSFGPDLRKTAGFTGKTSFLSSMQWTLMPTRENQTSDLVLCWSAAECWHRIVY